MPLCYGGTRGVSQNCVPHKRAERYRPPPSILVVFHTFFECNANDTYVLRMTHISEILGKSTLHPRRNHVGVSHKVDNGRILRT